MGANTTVKLVDHQRKIPARGGFGPAIKEAGARYPELMLFTNDLRAAIRCEEFICAYPNRFVENGIAEQNMIGMAAGVASCGKLPFVVSYATFATWRVAEQVRNDISYTNFNVKIVSMTTGVTFGQGGMSHQTFEDLTLIRCLPNFTVLAPADAEAHNKAVFTAAAHRGPTFLRCGRDDEYEVYAKDGCPFEVGGSNLLREGTDIALIACGFMVRESLMAAELLAKRNISAAVLDLYSIKPIDKETLFNLANTCKAFMTIEEHFIEGGMGSAVLEAFSGRRCPPTLLKGIDGYPPIGPKFEVRDHIGLCAASIEKEAIAFLETL
ncbi:MAG: transketolase family protein [Planctomycetes bacterium]|nr:transketolase family protein [Planctomycetota bacterium]